MLGIMRPLLGSKDKDIAFPVARALADLTHETSPERLQTIMDAGLNLICEPLAKLLEYAIAFFAGTHPTRPHHG